MASHVLDGVSPHGWEHSIKKMKKSGAVDNPFALAWYMKKRGYKPAKDAETDANFDRDMAAALQEVLGSGFPRECLEAASGHAHAITRCLDAGQYVLERKWW